MLTPLRRHLNWAASLWFISMASLSAQEAWNNTGAGDWFNASNWSPMSQPSSTSTVTIDDGGTATVGTAGASSGTLYLGVNDLGNLNISGGSLSASVYIIGKNANSEGALLVTGSTSTLTDTSSTTYVGFSGAGSLEIENGGYFSTQGGDLDIGYQTGSSGSVTVTGANSALLLEGLYPTLGVGTTSYASPSSTDYGTASVNISAGGVVSDYLGAIGHGGSVTVTGSSSWYSSSNVSEFSGGNLQITAGASLTTPQAYLQGNVTIDNATMNVSDCTITGTATIQDGASVSSSAGYASGDVEGSVTVTGTNTFWTDGGQMKIGDQYTTASLQITNGGEVTDTEGLLDQGSVTVSGKSFWSNSSDLYIGNTYTTNPTASLVVQNGGVVSAADTYIYTGSATISGTGSHLYSGTSLYVGYDYSGNQTTEGMLVEGGGQVSDNYGYIGYYNFGTVTVDGANSVWTNALGLTVGDGTTGSLTVQNGGTVQVGPYSGGIVMLGSAGTVSIGNDTAGGTLSASAVDFTASGAKIIFDETDLAYSFGLNLVGAGSISQTGPGTTILTSPNSNFTGSLSVSSGALLIKGSLGSASSSAIVSGGTLGGSGSLVGAVTLDSAGTVAPGGDGGNGHFTVSSLTWNGGGVLKFDLGSTSSLLSVTGAFTKGTAGAFDFDLENGGGLAPGTYDLVNFGSTTFSLGNFSYTSPLTGLTGHFLEQGNELEFDVQTVPEPGAWELGVSGLAAFALLRRRSLRSAA